MLLSSSAAQFIGTASYPHIRLGVILSTCSGWIFFSIF